MTNTETTPATPEGDAVSRALPNAYYECAGCTQQGSESNCRPAEEIRLAPDETWLCEYCYDDAAYECGEDANWPVWADLPKLSAAITAQPVAQEPVALTYQQKLEALSLRFYQGMAWSPKPGDYYTTSRADLELYQVVDVDGGKVKTRYCCGSTVISEWPEDEFTTGGFGPKRVYVPDFVLRAQSAPVGGEGGEG